MTPEQRDKEWLESTRANGKVLYLQRERKMIYGENYIEFPEIRDAKFYFGELGFKAKVVNTLKKLDVHLSSEEL